MTRPMERIDASILADFERCPKLYDYKHNHGYRSLGSNIDIIFGSLLGEALELFEKAVLRDIPVMEAQSIALKHVIANAVNPDGTHKFGSFVPSWRCTGTEPYKNEKGNAAKCPYSHKGKFYPAPAPEICSCGSKTESHDLWMPTKSAKDIHKLTELLLGYTDAAQTRALVPVAVEGQPMVEHYWEVPFEHTMLLRPILLCGNWDAVKKFGSEHFVVDYKTTGKSIGHAYWSSFTPNVQVDLYNMAATKVLPQLDIQGVAIEAFSTAGMETGFKLFRATVTQKAEMFEETAAWIGLLQCSQETGLFPRNRTACFMCQFQPVCSSPPEARQAMLDSQFERAKWNPQTRKVEPVVRQNDAPPADDPKNQKPL